ncbi:MAG: efflux RND transporter periplasmic adaptor subunit [Polyangiaceae bacterium]
MNRHFSILGLAAILGFAAACTKSNHDNEAPKTPTRVEAGLVQEAPIASVYHASGTVRGRNTTTITSKSMGYVRKVLVRAGDRVSLGQPLAQLEVNDVRASFAKSRAALDHAAASKLEAESALEAVLASGKVAKLVYERESSLMKSEAISPQQFDEAEARFRSSAAQELMARARVQALESNVAEAKAALAEAQAMLDYGNIVSPFEGRVVERRIDPGALAAPGVPLFVVAEENTQRVEVSVDATRADGVREGDEVDVSLDTIAEPMLGKVSEIVPSVDVSSRAFTVKIDLPKELGPMRPGTFARVGFRVGTRARLVVPKTAVTSFGAVTRVFVMNDARAQLRMITVGETHGAFTEVLSGLSPNERVITSPPSTLRDGALVEVRL